MDLKQIQIDLVVSNAQIYGLTLISVAVNNATTPHSTSTGPFVDDFRIDRPIIASALNR